MVDIVVNDLAYPGAGASVDYSTFGSPFNNKQFFHPFCFISNYDNQTDVEDVGFYAPVHMNVRLTKVLSAGLVTIPWL